MRSSTIAAATSVFGSSVVKCISSDGRRRNTPHPCFFVKSVGANRPTSEDTFAIHFRKSGGDLFGVWDGHGGDSCSRFAAAKLLPWAASALDSGISVEKALLQAQDYTETAFRSYCWERCDGLGEWELATVGACSLVVHVSENNKSVSCSNAGDCRAVLASDDKGVLSATPLSSDHNARILEEREKLLRDHDGETDIVYQADSNTWYVKHRIQMTRCLGDFYLKEARFNVEQLGNFFITSEYTPPYLSWTPDITSHAIRNGRDIFLIMATDGLWDELCNIEAVRLAADALKRNLNPAEVLVHTAMTHAAKDSGMTLEQLDKLAPISPLPTHFDTPKKKVSWTQQFLTPRRGFHDDITVIVIVLDEQWKPSVE